ncbi:hypothetical protein GGG87_08205 [Streptococcus sp. zg-86]|uniref:Rhodanese domain-containing protein n=1 Tax=Streptococcus zhangguiae TaxID=2664091 RepID=A0A6I4RJF2_9STRE|nr:MULTISPECIES: rhodanese-like domain-containing protein [unclassified Streptococcus]MTB64978.1 hypothetical protein [Streptococcus sp. zg-86]MTB91192.1 hypothetical protein [Streptococcus sp. zg-36]MWV56937.1 hypothetical protein [Streptococcus sp. zg-70]QTH47175.1 rhodanese-like domain-containing protein [Streptococcus sp. zg-86]
MKKSASIFLALVLLLGFVGYEQFQPKAPPKENQLIKTQLRGGGGMEARINWSKASQDAQIYQIRFEQVRAAVMNGAKCYDVRSFIEYQLGHVDIAEPLPLSTLEKQEFPSLIHDVPIYLYGSDGVSSAQAARSLRDQGFRYVYDLGSLEQIKVIGARLKEWWE